MVSGEIGKNMEIAITTSFLAGTEGPDAYSFGFKSLGLGFRVQVLGFRVWGLGFRV